MKKIDEITIPAKPAYTRKVELIICDFCGINNQKRNMSPCSMCNRDVCNGLDNSCRRSDPTDPGDYPAKFCPICYELMFIRYKLARERIEKNYEKKIAALERKIKEESLATNI